MEQIIKWLMGVEHVASSVYEMAALYFSEDEKLKEFLEQNARDEAGHYHVMASALEHFHKLPPPEPAVSLDEDTDRRINSYFKTISDRLNSNTLTREILLENILLAELSEWNHLFLHVVDYLKNHVNEFKYSATKIQAHKKNIELFFDEYTINIPQLHRLKKKPDVWTENILIVDDDALITNLLTTLLSREGNIDVAHDGQSALSKMESSFYKLIISDIDMPIMNGIRFFENADALYPNINKRFLFITGNIDGHKKRLFASKNIDYLIKPMNITELRNRAAKILSRQLN